tara:strand:- start:167 stop:775 length:609 start_codon:yes stop_codon:yes gene_type:complete
MADRVEGSVSLTPLVTVSAEADADSFDTIQHDIKGVLSGQYSYETANEGDVWFYAPNVIATYYTDNELFADSSDQTDLVGASGNQSDPNEATGSAVVFTNGNAADCNTDEVMFLFIKNTGTSDINGTVTTSSVYVTFDGNDSTSSTTSDAIEIGAGEAWMGKFGAGVDMDEIHIRPGLAKGTGTGTSHVRCTVAAIIDDKSV